MSNNKFFSGFALGAAAGVAAGFMLHKNKGTFEKKLRYLKLRADIERQLRTAKKFTREAYNEIVENTLEEYGDRMDISAAKLALIEAELKDQWREIKRRFQSAMQEADEEEDDDDED